MKYRLCGVDVTGEHVQFGHASTLEHARSMQRQLKARGLVVYIQNTKNGKIQ